MGLFDRSTAGHVSSLMRYTLERGAMLFFAETIGASDPACLDVAAARAKGYPDILATPTYGVVVSTLAERQARRAGAPDLLERIDADLRYLLHGTEGYTYHGPMFAGDTVSVETEITRFSDAADGALEIAHIAQRITHPERGRLIDIDRALIHRLPTGGDS